MIHGLKHIEIYPAGKTYTSLDASSHKSPQSIINTNDLQFEYNKSDIPKTISLNQPMIDIKGIKYSNSITLQPYTSVVLMKDKNPDILSDLIDPVINTPLQAFGNAEVYGSLSTSTNLRAMPVTFSEAAEINSISIYHEGGTGNMLMGVYSDKSGTVSSRIGVTASTKVNSTSGWQTVPLSSPVTVAAGQTIWLAWVFQNRTGVRFTSGASTRAVSPDYWTGGMPLSFGTASYDDFKYSIYCSTTSSPSLALGNTEVYGSLSTSTNLRAMPVTFNDSGEINSISIYHEGGTGNILMGVYSDQSGTVSSRIGVTASTKVNSASGWQTVSLTSPVTVAAGQTIWLAWVFQNRTGVRFTSGAPARAVSPDLWTGGMPLSFGNASYNDFKYSIYCSYTNSSPSLALGNTEVYGSLSTSTNLRAMPVTFSEAGEINSISIYHEGGTGNMLMGIYSDKSGTVSSRIGVTATTQVNSTSGWQTVPLASPVTVSAGQTIWLAWVFQNRTGVRFTSGAPARAVSPDSMDRSDAPVIWRCQL